MKIKKTCPHCGSHGIATIDTGRGERKKEQENEIVYRGSCYNCGSSFTVQTKVLDIFTPPEDVKKTFSRSLSQLTDEQLAELESKLEKDFV